MTATFKHIKRNNVAGFTAPHTFINLRSISLNREKSPIKGAKHQW
jgi:hypothetical protein